MELNTKSGKGRAPSVLVGMKRTNYGAPPGGTFVTGWEWKSKDQERVGICGFAHLKIEMWGTLISWFPDLGDSPGVRLGWVAPTKSGSGLAKRASFLGGFDRGTERAIWGR